MATILPSEANAIAQRLSNGCVHVEANDREICLVDPECDERVKLLLHQMTDDGVEQALVEFVMWSRTKRHPITDRRR